MMSIGIKTEALHLDHRCLARDAQNLHRLVSQSDSHEVKHCFVALLQLRHVYVSLCFLLVYSNSLVTRIT